MADEFSKPLTVSLADGSLDTSIGSISRSQLLLTSLIERLHDAIYVIPRYVREGDSGVERTGPPPDPQEYTRDIVSTLRALQETCMDLPDDQEEYDDLTELNSRLLDLRNKNKLHLEQARLCQERLRSSGMED
jgi:hypothetical protein